MKSFKKAFFVSFICLVMVFSMLPLQAFATETQYDVVFPFAEPYVSDNQGYIVYEMKDNDGNFYYYLYYITCIPTNYFESSQSGSGNLPSAKPLFRVLGASSSSNITTFSVFVGLEDNYSYMTQGTFYYSSGRPFYQDAHFVQGGGSALGYTLSYDVPLDLTFSNYYCKGPFQTSPDLVPFDPILKVGFVGDNDYYNEFQEIIIRLSTLVANDVTKIQALNDMLDRFNTLISNTDNIESQLDIANSYLKFIRDYIQLYFPEMTEVLWYIDTELLTVIEKLDKIIDLLEPDTEVNVSTLDPSNFNEYNKAEQSLLDNSNVDVSGALNVEIDQNALMFIWPLAERVLNTHPQVIGLVFTILSISIVALVLGRKGG